LKINCRNQGKIPLHIWYKRVIIIGGIVYWQIHLRQGHPYIRLRAGKMGQALKILLDRLYAGNNDSRKAGLLIPIGGAIYLKGRFIL